MQEVPKTNSSNINFSNGAVTNRKKRGSEIRKFADDRQAI